MCVTKGVNRLYSTIYNLCPQTLSLSLNVQVNQGILNYPCPVFHTDGLTVTHGKAQTLLILMTVSALFKDPEIKAARWDSAMID